MKTFAIASCLPLIGAGLALARMAPEDRPALSLEEKEQFLKTAKVTEMKPLGLGVTRSHRATLDDGTLRHDAHVQSIDEYKASFVNNRGTELNFRDSYKYNIAAYELGRMLGLDDMIPPSVQRRVGGQTSAVTWWVDDVLMDEAARHEKNIAPRDIDGWNKAMERVRVFDQLIYNTDRNLHNLLITKDWRISMIDHTRAFRRDRTLRARENLTRCDRQLLEKMRALRKEDLNAKLKPWLIGPEIDAVLARRDLILKFFETAAASDPAAIYDWTGK